MFLRKFLLSFLLVSLISLSNLLKAQVVTGRIVTEEKEPVPYATIYVPANKEGTISNTEGNFNLHLPLGNYHLIIRSLGFIQVEKDIEVNSDSIGIDVIMRRQEFQIKEVKVFPGKEDPAYFIMRKAIAKAPYYRSKIKHYEAGLYIRSNFSFSNIPKIYQNKVEVDGRKLKDVLKENVTYVIESQNRISFDFPNRYEQKVISKKTSLVGIDEPPVMELINTSFYEERPNEVISPLSSIALRHYNFQYEGYVTAGNFDVFKIKVAPKRKSDELVEGHIYIVDKLWCIYSLDFSSSFEFFNYRIKQQFENIGNDNWLPVSHNIDGNLSALGLKGQFYYGASLKYENIEDNAPGGFAANSDSTGTKAPKPREKGEKEQQLLAELNSITSKEELSNNDVKKAARLNRKILKEQYMDSTIVSTQYNNYKIEDVKDSVRHAEILWDTIRTIPLTPAEIRSYQVLDSLVNTGNLITDSISGQKKKKEKSLFAKIATGDYDLAKDSLVRLTYDGLISTSNFDYNAVDGYKYKQAFRIRIYPDSGKFISIFPELGYAFNRQAVFGQVESSFRNIFWKNGTVFLNAGKLSSDFKSPETGIHPALNAISTWFFAANYIRFYENTYLNLGWNQQIKRGFDIFGTAGYNYFRPLENTARYVINDDRYFAPNIPKGHSEESPELQKQKSFEYSLGLNYTKRLRKPWLQESPFLFLNDYYLIRLEFKQGLKNLFSSVSDFSQIDFTFHHQANLSPNAGIDWQINAGYFFNADQLHFSQFKHFKTAEIPVQFSTFSHTFQLLNDYEYSTSKSYLNLGFEYRTEYVLLRYLSLINRKTWSESLHLNYLTTPGLHHYWEAGYSLNSLFFIGNIGVFAGFKGTDFESIMVKISISVFD